VEHGPFHLRFPLAQTTVAVVLAQTSVAVVLNLFSEATQIQT